MSESGVLLARGAEGAGLSWPPVPWPTQGSFAERLSKNPFLMAPMAGVSDRAWRLMARAGGAAVAYSEMVSVAGLHFASEKTWELVLPDAEEPDLAVQLFGSDPSLFAEAAEKVGARLGGRLAFLDVNMACPVAKVVRKGEGVALMDDPAKAAAIVEACRAGLSRCGLHTEVTAKIRLGRSPERPMAVELAKALEEAGVAAIAVHGRYGSQGYAGRSSKAAIAEVVGGVGIPVLASGDALDAQRCVQLLDDTGAAGVLVARGSYGNPWIFSDARALEGGEGVPERPLELRLCALELHLRLLAATGEHMLKARQIACHYLKGLPGAAAARRRIMQCSTIEGFLELVGMLRAGIAQREEAR